MGTFNMHEAKTHFSKLVDFAMHGQEVIIAKAGVPVLKLEPIKHKKPKYRLGVLKGKIKIPESFYDPLPEHVLKDFEA